MTTSPESHQGMAPRQLIRDPGHLLSLGFGSGLSPYAPGTMGTLVAVPLYLLAVQTGTYWYAAICVLVCVAGVFLCGRTARALGVHDHPAIVWDEVAGFFITMLFVPVSWSGIVVGFILFRVFDILKPWPISVIDSRLKGGLGVMLDDVLAGVYAVLVLQLIIYLGWTG